MTVLQILSTRFSALQLKGFRDGWFDAAQTKLIAFTLLPVHDPDYADLDFFFLKGVHSMQFKTANNPNLNTYNADGTYTPKHVSQLVKEGWLNYVRLYFAGILYKGEWFIISTGRYYEEDNETALLELIANEVRAATAEWNEHGFTNVQAFEEQTDMAQLALMLAAETGTKATFAYSPEILAFLSGLDPAQVPKQQQRQQVSYREFTGQPWIAAWKKQETKSTLNRHFEAYINEALVVPLAQALRSQHPQQFCSTQTLGLYYPLIYPHTKEQVIAIIKVTNASGTSRLYYFVYVFADKKLFEWTHPVPASADGDLWSLIIHDIANLSSWGKNLIFMNHPLPWMICISGMSMFSKRKIINTNTCSLQTLLTTSGIFIQCFSNQRLIMLTALFFMLLQVMVAIPASGFIHIFFAQQNLPGLC